MFEINGTVFNVVKNRLYIKCEDKSIITCKYDEKSFPYDEIENKLLKFTIKKIYYKYFKNGKEISGEYFYLVDLDIA